MHVNNIFQFAQHVSAHRKRVQRLAWSFREAAPNREVLKIVLAMHDMEKYLLLPLLWRYYNGRGDRAKADVFFKRMNAVGRKLLEAALATVPHTPGDRAAALILERLADVVDRNCDPVALEEFNLKARRPLRDFLDEDYLPAATAMVRRWRRQNRSAS